jgi:4'-phosphopantetheinyl transferase
MPATFCCCKSMMRKGNLGMDLYYADISRLQPRLPDALALLPEDLQKKAKAHKKLDDQLRSVTASLLLLQVLHLDSGCSLQYGEYGKPCLPDGPEFSLSHSGIYTVLAVGRSPLGVDIEAPRSISPLLRRRCFTGEEQIWAHDDNTRYLQLWTRKESVMKATGLGLSLPAREINTVQDTASACGIIWHLHSLRLGTYMLSTAAAEPACPILHKMDTPDLLGWQTEQTGSISPVR